MHSSNRDSEGHPQWARLVINRHVLLAPAAALLAFLGPFDACWSSTETEPPVHAFGARLNYDLKASYWFTSDDDDGEKGVGNALDYQPQVIPTQALQGIVLWRGSPVVGVGYTRALRGNAEAKAATLETSGKAATLKKLSAFFDFQFLEPYSQFANHLRVDYKRHVFLGKAKAQEATTYVTADAVSTQLVPGDEVRFKSEFEEISITWRISDFGHIGVYHQVTRKPHETSVASANSLVLETEISGTGVKFISESSSLAIDLNVGVTEFRADQYAFKSEGIEFLVHTEWRPHLYLIGSESAHLHGRHTLALVPTIGAQLSMQYGFSASGFQSNGTGELSMDIIADAGLRIEYQF